MKGGLVKGWLDGLSSRSARSLLAVWTKRPLGPSCVSWELLYTSNHWDGLGVEWCPLPRGFKKTNKSSNGSAAGTRLMALSFLRGP